MSTIFGKKRMFVVLFLVVFLFIGFVSAGTVTRAFNATNVAPGEEIEVNLTIDVTGESFYVIEELVPTGWTITDLGGGTINVTANPNRIVWVDISNPIDVVLTYKAVAPGVDGLYVFDGNYSFVANTAFPILGENSVTVTSGPASGNLVLHYEFENNVLDSSGFGNDGVLVGSPLPTYNSAGAIGSGIDFILDTGEGVEVSSPSSLNPAGNLTISAWIKTSSIDSSGSEILSMGDSYALRIESDGNLNFVKYVGGLVWLNIITSGQNVLDDSWHHVAGMQNDSGMYVFVDGVVVASNSNVGAIDYSLGTSFFVGRHGDGSSSFDFDGTMDDVRVYDVALSEAEIRVLANARNLILWLEAADDASDGVVLDSSNYGNDGNCLPGVSCPVFDVDLAGRFDEAYEFDGVGDYVDFGKGLMTSNSVTYGGWFRWNTVGTGGEWADFPGNFFDMLIDQEIGNNTGYQLYSWSGGGTGLQCYNGVVRPPNDLGATFFGPLNVDEWYHVACVFNSTSVSIYVNGSLEDSLPHPSGINPLPSTNANFTLGAAENQSTYWFNGSADDVRVYNYSLTDSEILNWFNEAPQVSACVDGDGDGYNTTASVECGVVLDCNDLNGNVYPGANEICDGFDNQCPGDVGFGQTDEGGNALCDNALFCDGAEMCGGVLGCVAGTPPSVDDGVSCTVDSCDEVNDVVINSPQDNLCDDALFCNGAETCHVTLDCQAGTPPVLSDGVGCTVDSCDEINDVVVNAPNDALCDNGLACDGSETCHVTLDCQAGTNPCTLPEICNEGPPQTCTLPPGSCFDDTDCNDGAFCNGVETCNIGANTCVAGTPPTVDDGVSCTVDSCNEATDSIDNVPSNALCDDGAFCTGVETCDAILDCQAGTPPTVDDGVSCTNDSCDEVNDVVVNQVDDSNCNDGAFCNGAETCDAILDCQAGVAPVIDDGVSCTDDSCDEINDVVLNQINHGNCDNGFFCDGNEICDPSLDCQSGSVPCSFPEVCNEGIDQCELPPGACFDDTDCNDGAFCNGVETCNLGTNTCEVGTAPTVDDGVSCTVDSCDEVNDIVLNQPLDSLCDNGLFCDGSETCDAILDCQVGTVVNCDDGISCTVDSCDEINDQCQSTENHAACNNGAFCDGAELCTLGVGCVGGAAIDCSAQDISGVNSCFNSPDDVDGTFDLRAGFVSTCDEVNDVCETGDSTITHTCDSIQCSAAQCEDNSDCTGLEVCNSICQCSGVQCSVHSDCSSGDYCDSSGSCVPRIANSLACDATNRPVVSGEVQDGVCLSGFCNLDYNGDEYCVSAASVCTHLGVEFTNGELAPDCFGATSERTCSGGTWIEGTNCDDGLFCTTGDQCVLGQCEVHAPLVVDDGVSCTVDSCDEVNDVVLNQPLDSLCDNGLFCDGAETCDAVFDCQSGASPCLGGESCDEINQCQPILCNNDNIRDATEQCDGIDLNFETCVSLDYPAGDISGQGLACFGPGANECTFDTSGCSILPKYDKFNGTTTNFTDEADIFNVPSSVLEITGFGKIDFTNILNYERLDLDQYVVVEQNRIGMNLNGNRMIRINDSAVVTFYGVDFDEPNVLRDGVDCAADVCNVTNYTKSVLLEMEVPGFSLYEVVEGASPPGTDGSGGGGGGGGGGGTPQCNDGRDNDLDGLIDYPDDPDCTSTLDSSELGVQQIALPTCVEIWSCGSWSECVDGRQVLDCTDANNCPNPTRKPVTERSCEDEVIVVEEEPEQIFEGFRYDLLFVGIIIFIALIVLVISLILWLHRDASTKRKRRELFESVRKHHAAGRVHSGAGVFSR